MIKAILVTLLVAGANCFPDNRIVNGTDAVEGEIPYIISLQVYGSHSCGGSILDSRHVLTAAHCVDGSSPSLLSIKYGITDLRTPGNTIQVSRTVVHAGYSPWNNFANDIAILRLAEPIKFSPIVKETVLPEQDAPIPGNEASVLAGWGLEQSGGSVQRHLQRVDLKVYTPEECSQRHGGRTDPAYHVCSGVDEGGKGQCSGDSGGPLYSGGVQIGIVSWSVKPCAVRPYPGVFTRVSKYVDWINNNLI